MRWVGYNSMKLRPITTPAVAVMAVVAPILTAIMVRRRRCCHHRQHRHHRRIFGKKTATAATPYNNRKIPHTRNYYRGTNNNTENGEYNFRIGIAHPKKKKRNTISYTMRDEVTVRERKERNTKVIMERRQRKEREGEEDASNLTSIQRTESSYSR